MPASNTPSQVQGQPQSPFGAVRSPYRYKADGTPEYTGEISTPAPIISTPAPISTK